MPLVSACGLWFFYLFFGIKILPDCCFYKKSLNLHYRNHKNTNGMISPLAYISPEARLGENVTVHPFAYIDAGTVVGDGCVIFPHASIMAGTVLGKNVKVYNGAIVGADPQDFRWNGCASHCYIGDNAVIRENVIINRGIEAQGGTSIGADTYLLAETHVGHDSHIAGHCVLGNGVKIAGNVTIAEGTILSSGVIIHEDSNIGKFVLIKGGTRISGNVPPFVIMAHNPVVYYGVNAQIMRKHAGFSEDEIDVVAKAYRHIYQCHTSLFNAMSRIENDIDPCPVRDEILSFIRGGKAKLAGFRFDED